MRQYRNFNKIKFSLCNDMDIPESRQKPLQRKPSRKKFVHPKRLATLCGYFVDETELPSQFKWTTVEVLEWIKALGFPQYQNTFEVNLINGQKLILVDASALVKMNIKDFQHIKKISKEIRSLFQIELKNYDRSISLPSQNSETLFKFFKVPSGPIHELCQRTEFYQKMKLMGEAEIQLNHFEELHKWLQHIPDFQHVRVGGIKRVNLFFVKPDPNPPLELDEVENVCHCKMPPCECNWSEKEKRKPWRLSFLVQVAEGKYEKSCAKSDVVVDVLVLKE